MHHECIIVFTHTTIAITLNSDYYKMGLLCLVIKFMSKLVVNSVSSTQSGAAA